MKTVARSSLADIKTKSADVWLKMITILSKLRKAQLCPYNDKSVLAHNISMRELWILYLFIICAIKGYLYFAQNDKKL